MQENNKTIVTPSKGKNPSIAKTVGVMVSVQNDLRFLCSLMNIRKNDCTPLFMSNLYASMNCSIVGPFIGAPYAAILLETLIARGAKKVIFWGWCGAVSDSVKIGDIIVPTASIIDEGTSKHYQKYKNDIALPSLKIVEKIKNIFFEKNIAFHEGVVWSTDAVYRETRKQVEFFQKRNVLAVEMELSALFTIGKYHNVEVGGILVVSDEISSFKHIIGFNEKRFKKSRKIVAEVVKNLCLILQN